MKKYIIVLFLFFLHYFFSSFMYSEDWAGVSCCAQVAINLSGNEGNASSMLDIEANNKGLLIPRLGLTSATDIITITSPATSLLVYNTATAGISPNNIIPGYYYWDGIKWIPLSSQSSTSGIIAFADFYALMPPDNAATVAPGSAVEFPNAGPASGLEITAISNTQFQLSAAGIYMVSWQVSINEPGQLILEINGVENLSTAIGRATATSQIAGNTLIATMTSNSILRVVNPSVNSTALTITPLAGGARSVSASLVIMRIQ